MILNLVRHQQETLEDNYLLLTRLGQMWLFGISPDWPVFCHRQKPARVPLPLYPFDVQPYPPDQATLKKVAQLWSSSSLESPVNRSGGKAAPESAELPPPELKYQTLPGMGPDFLEDTETPFQAPRNDVEQKIAGIWEEFLGFKRISIHANFFHLNGDSLSATQVVARIKDLYPIEVQLQEFFENPTIAHLAELVKKRLIEKIKNLSPAEKLKLAGKSQTRS
jgi:acyl carrier protein